MKLHYSFSKRFGFRLLLMTLILGQEFISGAQTTPQYSYQAATLIANTIPFATAATSSNKRQWIFTPSEFSTAPSGYITKIYVKASAVVSPNFTGFLIRMGNTTQTTFTGNTTFVTNLDTVLYASSISLSSTTNNWIPIQLQTPFFYSGSSNFIVEGSHQGYSPGFSIMQSTITGRSLFGNSGNATGSVQDRLADFGFDLIAGINDVELNGFLNINDTLCSGTTNVGVILKNNGPNPLSSVKIAWRINNVPQTNYNWSGNLAVNDTLHLILGSFTFNTGNVYNVETFCFNPNNVADTTNANDTITLQNIFVRPSPGIVLGSVSSNFCPGDSVLLSGTLSGIPPWSFIVQGPGNPLQFSNLSNPNFNLYIFPTTNAAYTLVQLSDASGCISTDIINFNVTVKPTPPSTISPFGSAACQGDSIMLIGNTGTGFSYQWNRDGTPIPGDTNYIHYAKISGLYTLLVTGSNSCSTLSSPYAITIHAQPTVYLGNDTVLLPSASLPLNAGPGFVSYQWSTGATTQQIILDTTGIGIGVKYIWVKATDINACHASDTIRVHFTPNPGFEDLLNTSHLLVSPNPSDGEFEIEVFNPGEGYLDITLYYPDGRVAQTSRMKASGNPMRFNLDCGQYEAGVYLLRISADGAKATGTKLIKR